MNALICQHCSSKDPAVEKIEGKRLLFFCAGCDKLITDGAKIGDEDKHDRIYLEAVEDMCQEIMDSKNTTIKAKTVALDMQIASQRMSLLIKTDEFFKEEW